jgi:hypothetical protein
MVIITTENNNLILHVKGMGKILAFKSEMTIPIEHIKGVTADSGAFDMPKGIRAPGTAVPGIVYAGTFYHDGDKVFWDVHNRAKTIVIELRDEEFSRLIVEVENVDEAVKLIEEGINK